VLGILLQAIAAPDEEVKEPAQEKEPPETHQMIPVPVKKRRSWWWKLLGTGSTA
jgi:hypothetical protein